MIFFNSCQAFDLNSSLFLNISEGKVKSYKSVLNEILADCNWPQAKVAYMLIYSE